MMPEAAALFTLTYVGLHVGHALVATVPDHDRAALALHLAPRLGISGLHALRALVLTALQGLIIGATTLALEVPPTWQGLTLALLIQASGHYVLGRYAPAGQGARILVAFIAALALALAS